MASRTPSPMELICIPVISIITASIITLAAIHTHSPPRQARRQNLAAAEARAELATQRGISPQ